MLLIPIYSLFYFIYISVNSWYLNKPDEDWYWLVKISQLNSISRCLISSCKSRLDCNVLNLMHFDWSRFFWIRRWARLIVHGFCSGFLTLILHNIILLSYLIIHTATIIRLCNRITLFLNNWAKRALIFPFKLALCIFLCLFVCWLRFRPLRMPRTREQHYPSKPINYSYSKKVIRRCMRNILCSLN